MAPDEYGLIPRSTLYEPGPPPELYEVEWALTFSRGYIFDRPVVAPLNPYLVAGI